MVSQHAFAQLRWYAAAARQRMEEYVRELEAYAGNDERFQHLLHAAWERDESFLRAIAVVTGESDEDFWTAVGRARRAFDALKHWMHEGRDLLDAHASPMLPIVLPLAIHLGEAVKSETAFHLFLAPSLDF